MFLLRAQLHRQKARGFNLKTKLLQPVILYIPLLTFITSFIVQVNDLVGCTHRLVCCTVSFGLIIPAITLALLRAVMRCRRSLLWHICMYGCVVLLVVFTGGGDEEVQKHSRWELGI